MKRVLVQRGRYFDSVFLMRISQELERRPDVIQAIVAMGTPMNVTTLVDSDFALADPAGVRPTDLLVAIDAADEAGLAAAQDALPGLLAGDVPPADVAGSVSPTSLGEALDVDPKLNLALISVPGLYAAREARQALRRGLHVMLFSDNVSVEEEIALKDDARARGLLLMGPDCGTALVNGVPLGFANVVRRGSIGLVGASGTGIQEITCLIDRLGGGVSQAIGTGGRDLSERVAARSTLAGIDALADDPGAGVLVVVSKAPAQPVADAVVERLRRSGKPAVVHFVAAPRSSDVENVAFADTLDEAARLACRAAGLTVDAVAAASLRRRFDVPPGSADLRGFFCGGTLCQEAWAILRAAGLEVRSNVAADPSLKVRPHESVAGHVLWDLGDDAFTVGRPHPMIEPKLRDDRVAAAGADPSTAVILVDCVLGYGAHRNPAGSLADAVTRAADEARQAGRTPAVVLASITGTARDPQNAEAQRRTLEEAGIFVAESNAAAARYAAAEILGGEEGRKR